MIDENKAFDFPSIPTEICFGFGTLNRLPEKIEALKGTRALIVTDRGLTQAGLVGRVEEILATLDEPQRHRRAALVSRRDELHAARALQHARAHQTIYSLNAGTAAETHVLRRGDPDLVGELVRPAATNAIRGLSGDCRCLSKPKERRLRGGACYALFRSKTASVRDVSGRRRQ